MQLSDALFSMPVMLGSTVFFLCQVRRTGEHVRLATAAIQNYEWIVADPELLGGKLAMRGTRLSVALILECPADRMSIGDINEAFHGAFPPDALPEVMKVAAEFADSFHVVV